MTVVQIRPVRVGVGQRLVTVPVRVALVCGETGVRVQVMPVVVPMRVDVLLRRMDVRVPVPAREQQRDGEREQRAARQLARRERLAEPGPGERRAEEGCAREAGLRARRAEPLSRCDVERDAGAVAERADGQRGGHFAGARREGLEGEPEREIHSARGEPLPEGRARRGHAALERGELVVERPAGAGARDERRGEPARPAAAPGDDEPRRDHARDAECSGARERLVEEHDAEERGRRDLEVEEQRDRSRQREAEAEQQQHRTGDAARGDRAGEEPAALRVEPGSPARAALAHEGCRHRQRGPEVEEPREREGAEAPEQELAGRRRGAEERRRGESECDAVHDIPARRCRARPLG